jgi:hypothetical protein
MIDRAHDLSITKQAEALNISRGSVYYLPRPVPEADLAIMRRLDRLHLEFPFAGARMLRGLLVAEGCRIGRRHVKTLMKRMGIEALYRRPRTTKPEPGHKIYPYLLRGMEITRPNQVWAMDITYIPMTRGFVYLAVILDWFSRRVLSWARDIELYPCVEHVGGHAHTHGLAFGRDLGCIDACRHVRSPSISSYTATATLRFRLTAHALGQKATPELLLILPEHLVCRLRIGLFPWIGLSIISPRGAASGL